MSGTGGACRAATSSARVGAGATSERTRSAGERFRRLTLRSTTALVAARRVPPILPPVQFENLPVGTWDLRRLVHSTCGCLALVELVALRQAAPASVRALRVKGRVRLAKGSVV